MSYQEQNKYKMRELVNVVNYISSRTRHKIGRLDMDEEYNAYIMNNLNISFFQLVENKELHCIKWALDNHIDYGRLFNNSDIQSEYEELSILEKQYLVAKIVAGYSTNEYKDVASYKTIPMEYSYENHTKIDPDKFMEYFKKELQELKYNYQNNILCGFKDDFESSFKKELDAIILVKSLLGKDDTDIRQSQKFKEIIHEGEYDLDLVKDIIKRFNPEHLNFVRTIKANSLVELSGKYLNTLEELEDMNRVIAPHHSNHGVYTLNRWTDMTQKDLKLAFISSLYEIGYKNIINDLKEIAQLESLHIGRAYGKIQGFKDEDKFLFNLLSFNKNLNFLTSAFDDSFNLNFDTRGLNKNKDFSKYIINAIKNAIKNDSTMDIANILDKAAIEYATKIKDEISNKFSVSNQRECVEKNKRKF